MTDYDNKRWRGDRRVTLLGGAQLLRRISNDCMRVAMDLESAGDADADYGPENALLSLDRLFDLVGDVRDRMFMTLPGG